MHLLRDSVVDAIALMENWLTGGWMSERTILRQVDWQALRAVARLLVGALDQGLLGY